MDLLKQSYKAQNDNYRQSPYDMAISGASTLALIYYANKYGGQIKVPGSKVSSLRFLAQQSIQGQVWYEALGKTADTQYTVREFILNSIKGTEEQLLRIPRALSFSNIYSEGYLRQQSWPAPQSVNLIDKLKGGLYFDKTNLINKSSYLKGQSKGKITRDLIEEGLVFKDGKLYNLAGKEVLDHAGISFGYWNRHDDLLNNQHPIGYTSRYDKSIYRRHGLKPALDDITIHGAQNRFGKLSQKFGAMLNVGVENYMKLLDDPFEVVSKATERVVGNTVNTPWLQKGSKFWNTVGMRNILGVGGWQQLKQGGGSLALLKRHATRGLPLIAGAGILFGVADEILQSTLGTGIKSGTAKLYQAGTKGLVKASDLTGLTALSEIQEEKAPGSTSIFGLAAIPASFAIAGGTAGGIENLIRKVPIGDKGPAPKFFKQFAQHIESGGDWLGQTARKFNLSKKGRAGSYALIGAALGTIAVAPFIPGALGSSKSSEELDKIYSGEQLVPVRQGQRWEFGITPFKGGDIKHWEPHKTVQMITDANKKAKLGDFYGKPITRLLSRIADPYYLERSMDEERPYMYWGPTDQGFGFIEKLLTPIKEIFKPTILAHPEALGIDSPGINMRKGQATPESLKGSEYELNTRNASPDIREPAGKGLYAVETIQSFKDLLGLVGYTYGATVDKMTGSQGFIRPDAIYESSGRILSKQRAYWDQEFGGMAGLNEFYRRLNPAREYGPMYLQSGIRNTQPSWMPERFQYGDPYTSIPLGELRLPGKGYEEVNPELKGVDPEDYSAPHRLQILHDTARYSPQYYKAMAQTQSAVAEGRLNDSGVEIYNEVLRQEQVHRDDDYGNFDYGEGALGSYWLKLKQLGRSLPTEHLYPISPVHKLSGPVDPVSEYKSTILLDKSFKVWSNPFSDYIKPTYNSIMDTLTLGNFTPKETKDYRAIESYFWKMQAEKNELLKERAKDFSQQHKYEEASYLRSGIRKTPYDLNMMSDLEEQAALIHPRERKFFRAMAMGPSDENTLEMVAPEMRQMLQSQWSQADMMELGDYSPINALKRTPIQAPETAEMPSRNFIGYAPGVDLNSFKLKVVNNLGKNIRDHNLWKEDERQARILDANLNHQSLYSPVADYQSDSRETKRNYISNYLRSIGMSNAQMTVTPRAGNTAVEFHGSNDNKEILRNKMREEGMIVY